jgi:N-acetylneuraminic acid mutarotase
MSRRLLSLVAVSLLAACGGGSGGGDTPQSPVVPPATPPPPPPPSVIEVDGAVQKGPFLVGSTVLINLLDERGQSTPSTIVSTIDDSVGSFSFSTSLRGAAQLVASGYYFSELTGQVSSGSITLRAVYEITDTPGQVAHVNILTHLISDRVLKLFAGGNVTWADAIAQAESELLKAFSAALPVSGVGRFSELNIYSTSSQSKGGDVYLLALSTAFYRYASDKAKEFGTSTDAELTLILNQLTDDLEDDGLIQKPTFVNDFIRALRMLSPEVIIENLRKRSIVDYPQGLTVPDISVFLGLCAGDLECPWQAGAPVPLPGGVAVGYGGKVYLMAATSPAPDNPFLQVHKHSYEYDPGRNEWRQLASMPVDGPYPTAAVVGDKIYVHSGWSQKLLEYAPATNQWRELAPRPSFTKYGYTTAVVGGKLYVIGGTGGSQPDPVPQGDVQPRSDVDIYDPATNTWSKGRSTPMPLESWAESCVYGGEIYVFGGTTSLGSPTENFVWTYSPSQDSWSAKSPMTLARNFVACAEVGDEIYLFGGYPATGNTNLDLVERFDPLRQTWSSPTRLPTPRTPAGAVAIGQRIFIVGGSTKKPDFVEILDTDALLD